jgi:hypothetical protein
MARVLHLLPRAEAPLAATVIRQDLDAGDDVTVALLADAAPTSPLREGARVRRVPADWSYDRLLEEIFVADRVITW